MIVVRNIEHRVFTREQADEVRRHVLRGVRAGVLVVGSEWQVFGVPTRPEPAYRARRGPTPRWVRHSVGVK